MTTLYRKLGHNSNSPLTKAKESFLLLLMPKKKATSRKSNKLKRASLIILLFVALIVIGLAGFGFIQHQMTQNKLSTVLTNEWASYIADKPNFKGGLAMQILSPKGDYFMSTGMGNTMNNNTHFRTASVSKTFTAAAIMLLQQRGLLNIDDKIVDNIPGTNNTYVPDTQDYNIPNKKDITIRELLMHRAGVFDVSNNPVPENIYSFLKPYAGQSYIAYVEKNDPNHTFTFDEMVGVDATNHLSTFKPGTAYKYSNTGYSMLGKIIERVSGKSYADFVTSELLKPNGLTNTTVVDKGTDQLLPNPFVKGYEWADGQVEDVTKSNMSPHVAEGSVTTTPKDLATWAKKLFTGQAGLNQQTVQEMINACTSTGGGATTASQYGFGILCKDGWYGHNGAHAGYLSNMMYNPKTGVAYVIFTDSWNAQSFLNSTLDSLTGELKEMDTASNNVLQKLGY
jgi:D-alanyl-D-alanine carboxypeptidase